MKNFAKNFNSLAFRTPRWFIKSARDKFANKKSKHPDNITSNIGIIKKLNYIFHKSS